MSCSSVLPMLLRGTDHNSDKAAAQPAWGLLQSETDASQTCGKTEPGSPLGKGTGELLAAWTPGGWQTVPAHDSCIMQKSVAWRTRTVIVATNRSTLRILNSSPLSGTRMGNNINRPGPLAIPRPTRTPVEARERPPAPADQQGKLQNQKKKKTRQCLGYSKGLAPPCQLIKAYVCVRFTPPRNDSGKTPQAASVPSATQNITHLQRYPIETLAKLWPFGQLTP